MRKIFSLVILFTLVSSVAIAQSFQRGGKLNTPAKVMMMKAPAKAPADYTFSYMTSDQDGPTLLGTGKAETVHVAMLIPAEFAGSTVKSFTVPIVDKSVVKNVSGWVAANLNAAPGTTAFKASIADADLVDIVGNYINVLNLDEPYVIPEGGCYVGYTFTVTSIATQYGQYPIALTESEGVKGGLYINSAAGTGNSWIEGTDYGNAWMQATLGIDVPEVAASIAPLAGASDVALCGNDGNLTMVLTNKGGNALQSIDYTLTDLTTNEATSGTLPVSATELSGYAKKSVVKIPVKAHSTSGLQPMRITLNSANDVALEGEGLSADATLTVLAQYSSKKVVVEEFTSTSCGWCTRGIVGMETLAKRFPYSFVGICVHGTIGYKDPMQISSYNTVMNMVGGFPSAMINRGEVIDPYYGTNGNSLGIIDDYLAEREIPAEAAIKVLPQWTGEDSTKIDVTASVNFQLNRKDAPYALGYVLLADGLKGTAQGWTQTNYYSNYGSGDPYLAEWEARPQSYKGMEYENVAILARSIAKGIDGSIVAPIVENQAQLHTVTLTLPSDKNLTQNKRGMKVAAVLINTQTGRIVNADVRGIIRDVDMTIDQVTDDANLRDFELGVVSVSNAQNATEQARYDMNGRRLTAPTKGLNIVKMSDGTVKKIMVK